MDSSFKGIGRNIDGTKIEEEFYVIASGKMDEGMGLDKVKW